MSTALLWTFVVLLVLAGLLGTVLPGLPGAVLVFAGLLLAAWIDGFSRVGWLPLALAGFLSVISYGSDLAAASLGAKRFGASKWAVVGAGVGAVLGVFFGLPGILLGPFAGAVLGEFLTRRDLVKAGKAGLGAWLGFLAGTVARVALVLAMLAVFAVAYVW